MLTFASKASESFVEPQLATFDVSLLYSWQLRLT
ncbi:hypothetical protein N183_37885 [Sinorhizobium sp. Sb3]|nr:hypothetical protein N183_37885 [Sinorhizobium sp. Sb3]